MLRTDLSRRQTQSPLRHLLLSHQPRVYHRRHRFPRKGRFQRLRRFLFRLLHSLHYLLHRQHRLRCLSVQALHANYLGRRNRLWLRFENFLLRYRSLLLPLDRRLHYCLDGCWNNDGGQGSELLGNEGRRYCVDYSLGGLPWWWILGNDVEYLLRVLS